MGLGSRVERLLLSAEAEHHVSVPIELDNGDVAVFSGFRIQPNSARGPTKGGLRFHPSVDANDVRALASLMMTASEVTVRPVGAATPSAAPLSAPPPNTGSVGRSTRPLREPGHSTPAPQKRRSSSAPDADDIAPGGGAAGRLEELQHGHRLGRVDRQRRAVAQRGHEPGVERLVAARLGSVSCRSPSAPTVPQRGRILAPPVVAGPLPAPSAASCPSRPYFV